MSAADTASLVKQAVDIVEVVGQVVPLRRAGTRHIGLCPFHREKSPSFFVDSNSQLFHCFGCGSGGDVLTFIMRYQNISFVDAIEYLADRYHISIPKKQPASGGPPWAAEAIRREREELYEILSVAADFFHQQLHHPQAGKEAREYLHLRALPDRIVEAEKLGYALPLWDGLLRHLHSRGIAPEAGLKAGLLIRSSREQGRFYDRFRNRLMFPITDEKGHIIAFGGRIIGSQNREEPKYLNSPESAVFQKGRMLYQLAKAREACRELKEVILVEGYLDLLAFHAREFYRVVATLGTALTPQQIRLMSRFASEVVLAYDGDESGERAMLRTLPIFQKESLSVSCIRFPDGMDPDEFLKRKGLPEFEKLLKNRVDLTVYTLGKILDGWDGTMAGKVKVLREIQPIIKETQEPVLKAEYLRFVGDRLDLSETVLHQQLQNSRGQFHRGSANSLNHIDSLEEKVVRVMVHYPEVIGTVDNSNAIPCFPSSPLKTIAEVLVKSYQSAGDGFHLGEVYDRLPTEEAKAMYRRFLLEPVNMTEVGLQMDDWLAALLEREKKQQYLILREALEKAERAGYTVRTRELLSQIQNMNMFRKKH